jgi:uncharacterized membrane protein HdeD (DUF308 family)
VPWFLPLLRAAAAVAFAVVVTFSPDHSAPLGYLALGGYGIIAGATLLWGGFTVTGGQRVMLVAQGAVLAVAGALALLFMNGGLPFLVLLLSGAAVITGALELVSGLRTTGPLRRDRIFVGILTIVLAIAVLVVPPGLSVPTSGIDGDTGVLTASTIIVGVLGAYLAIIGVYLAIAAFSLKWASASTAEVGA